MKKKYYNLNEEDFWSEAELIQLWKDEKKSGINKTYEEFLECKINCGDFEEIK